MEWPDRRRRINLLRIQRIRAGIDAFDLLGHSGDRYRKLQNRLVVRLLQGGEQLLSVVMSTKSRISTLTLLSITGALLLTGCGSGESMVTLSFQAKSVERELLDTGIKGSSHGDLVAGYGDLLDSDGQLIGHFDVLTTVDRVTEVADDRFVQAEYSFGNEGIDSILISGAEQFPKDGAPPTMKRPAVYAVTGGTGIYKGAHGQCDVFRNEDPKAFTTTVNCSFAVLK